MPRVMSFMNKSNESGSKTEPWGTPGVDMSKDKNVRFDFFLDLTSLIYFHILHHTD